MARPLGLKKKLLFLVTEDWYFVSHRLCLSRTALKNGYDVSLVTQTGSQASVITENGIALSAIPFPRSFKRPWQDLLTLLGIYRAYRNIQPDIIHHVSLKPVIYGSFIQSLVTGSGKRQAVVNAFTGLGYVFTSQHPVARILRAILVPLLRILLKRADSHLVFQNTDDRDTLLQYGIARLDRCVVIPGSGVDTEKFIPSPEPGDIPVILLVARMLYDKGVEDFVNAVRLVKKQEIEAKFVLVGDTDPENPAGIPVSQLQEWDDEDTVEWWGRREDMPEVYGQSNIVVLPSHREGFPKTVIEAAACGRPVITTDVPGCRDAIVPGKTGLLVDAKNPQALAEAMIQLINARDKRVAMGIAGRKLVEEKYSTDVINSQFLDLYRNIVEKNND